MLCLYWRVQGRAHQLQGLLPCWGPPLARPFFKVSLYDLEGLHQVQGPVPRETLLHFFPPTNARDSRVGVQLCWPCEPMSGHVTGLLLLVLYGGAVVLSR